jgi:WD40 repeat protein
MAGTEEPVQSVAFSPDGKFVATGGALKGNGEVQIWELSSGTPKLVGSLDVPHAGRIVCVAYSPDGKILAAADYGHRVRLWDASTGMEKKQIELPEMDSGEGPYCLLVFPGVLVFMSSANFCAVILASSSEPFVVKWT